MKTIIIRKSDFRDSDEGSLWRGILSALNIPEHALDGKWDDLALSISKSSYIDYRNTEVIKCYE
jgi:hypothetical protein